MKYFLAPPLLVAAKKAEYICADQLAGCGKTDLKHVTPEMF
jgi:hypothetical protein